MTIENTVNDASTPGTPAEATTAVQPTLLGTGNIASTNEPSLKAEEIKLFAGKYKTAEDLEAGYKSLETKLGHKGISVPGEGASAEEVNAFWSQIGKPATPDEYNIALADGSPTELADWFKQTAHANNFTKTQAETFAQQYSEFAEKSATAAWNAQAEAAETALRSEYGAKYEANLKTAFSTLTSFVGEGEANRIAANYGNDAGLIKMLINFSKAVGEDTIADSGNKSFGVGKEQAMSEINAIMKDKTNKLNNAYWNKTDTNHKTAVDEVKRLAGIAYGG